jgi:hypothetical protein
LIFYPHFLFVVFNAQLISLLFANQFWILNYCILILLAISSLLLQPLPHYLPLHSKPIQLLFHSCHNRIQLLRQGKCILALELLLNLIDQSPDFHLDPFA